MSRPAAEPRPSPAEATGPASAPDRLAAIRQQLPLVQTCHYFNTGRYGPIPGPVHTALAAQAERELRVGRGTAGAGEVERRLADVRGGVETLLDAPTGSVALTHNASEGVNAALTSMRWSPGDEVVTLTTEHPSALAPLEVAAMRHGVTIRRLEPEPSPDAMVDQLIAALSTRTRAVMVSHVAWATGAALPLRPIADVVHALGGVLIADGAQSAGSIPLDVVALGVDFYAIPGQKWLCGPTGTGALYVRPDLHADALPGVAGWASIEDLDPVSGDCVWMADARRFEGSSDSVPLRIAFGEALRWLAEDCGWDWIHDRIRAGVRRCRALLEEVPGVHVITPPGDQAGLVCFTVDGLDPDAVVFRVARRRVLVRSVIHPRCVRACVGFFNDDDDILALRDAVAAAVGAGDTA